MNIKYIFAVGGLIALLVIAKIFLPRFTENAIEKELEKTSEELIQKQIQKAVEDGALSMPSEFTDELATKSLRSFRLLGSWRTSDGDFEITFSEGGEFKGTYRNQENISLEVLDGIQASASLDYIVDWAGKWKIDGENVVNTMLRPLSVRFVGEPEMTSDVLLQKVGKQEYERIIKNFSKLFTEEVMLKNLAEEFAKEESLSSRILELEADRLLLEEDGERTEYRRVKETSGNPNRIDVGERFFEQSIEERKRLSNYPTCSSVALDYHPSMQFERSEIVVFHRVIGLRKCAASPLGSFEKAHSTLTPRRLTPPKSKFLSAPLPVATGERQR